MDFHLVEVNAKHGVAKFYTLQRTGTRLLIEVENYNVSAVKLRIYTNQLNVRIGSITNFQIKLKQDDIAIKLEQTGLWYRIGDDEQIHSNYVIMG